MSDYTEVNAENLRFVRGSRGLTQEAVAEILGIPLNAISKIESGIRSLADSEKKLLDLFFFGTLPSGIVRLSEDLGKTLDLTEDEWRVVKVLAHRNGQTPEMWIKTRILDYLAMLEQSASKVESAEIYEFEPAAKAADTESPYGSKKPDAVGNKNAPGSIPPIPPPPKTKTG